MSPPNCPNRGHHDHLESQVKVFVGHMSIGNMRQSGSKLS